MEVSLLTPKCTLVPADLFEPEKASAMLSEVVGLEESDIVCHVAVPQYRAVLIYADSAEDKYSKTIKDISGKGVGTLPEMFYILRDLRQCPEYNKVVASRHDGWLWLGIAGGDALSLANVYRAPDFTTAEYFLFLALKSLQLNPEQTTVCWRGALEPEDEMSLCRYFKSVETL